MKKELSAIGLATNWGPDKSEAIPTAGSASTVDRAAIPSLHFNDTSCFKLLGAPIGTAVFCESVSQKRRTKAGDLLKRLPDLEDPQIALALLRHCGGVCKMSYSMRVVPRELHATAIANFDEDIRKAFNAAIGISPDDEAWKRAVRPVSYAGLGIRSVYDFSDAALVASAGSCLTLCQAIDGCFKAEDDITSSHIQEAIRRVNEKLPDCAHVKPSLEDTQSQKVLCAKLERGVIDKVLTSSDTLGYMKAHIQLMSAPGSGAWLHATPCRESRTQLDAPLFRIAVQRRLRMPLLHDPSHCTACGMGMDVYADHALVCGCKGDRTIRHNALRNCTYRYAKASALHPQREKAGLLPPRPDAEHIREKAGAAGRRPADIWMPHWCDNGPVALDFAVTCGLRSDHLHHSAIDHTHALTEYEDFKRNYLATAQQCEQQGIQFTPMVVDAHGGGWGPAAKEVFKIIARAHANQTGTSISMASSEIAQRISITLERENARAILRRLGPMEEDADVLANSAAWREDIEEPSEDVLMSFQ